MILSGIAALIASFLYLYGIGFLYRRIRSQQTNSFRPQLLKVTGLAAFFHFLSFIGTLFQADSIHISLPLSISVIAWGAVVTLLLTNINKNTGMLGIFILPVALLSTLLGLDPSDMMTVSFSMGSHILLSIFAYSVLTLATAQGILYGIQEKRFQQRKLTNLFKALPPLQVMEKTLIQLILMGFILLSFALLTGFFFIDDIFAQHLVHKTFFAILSWLTYATFLWGHFKKGWRGQKAAKYIIWAYLFLLLSYIGTQMILSFIVSA